jgi:uncharacterized membrane protein YccC
MVVSMANPRERLVAAFYGTVVGLFFGFWIAVLVIVVGVTDAVFVTIIVPMGVSAVTGVVVDYRSGTRPIQIATWIIDCLP